MNIPKKYQNNSIPNNTANRPKFDKKSSWLNPYERENARHLVYRVLYWHTPEDSVVHSDNTTIPLYTAEVLLGSGKYHLPFNLYEFMGKYGKSMTAGGYKPNYTSVMKYVAWSLDLHTEKKYTLPKSKSRRKK